MAAKLRPAGTVEMETVQNAAGLVLRSPIHTRYFRILNTVLFFDVLFWFIGFGEPPFQLHVLPIYACTKSYSGIRSLSPAKHAQRSQEDFGIQLVRVSYCHDLVGI